MRNLLAFVVVLGPLTGPLALGLLACLRAQRMAMAGVYAAGIAEVWIGLPAVLARLLAFLANYHH